MAMMRHFSHQHPLSPFQVEDEEKEKEQAICSGCELELSPDSDSGALRCEKPGCGFCLHQECSELPREIRHSSHAHHRLSLLFEPPQGFSCAACAGSSGTAFVYACRACGFGLHVLCSALPETVNAAPNRHPHPLALVPAGPTSCGACGCGFVKGCWAYSCSACDFAAHLECAVFEEDDYEPELIVEESSLHQIGKSQKEIAV